MVGHRFVSVCGLVVEYLVAIEVTRVRFPANARFYLCALRCHHTVEIGREAQGETVTC